MAPTKVDETRASFITWTLWITAFSFVRRGADPGWTWSLWFRRQNNYLDLTFDKGNCPVGIVVAHRGGDKEAARELGVNHHLFTGIQFLYEFTLNLRIRDDIIVDVLL